MMYNIYYGSIGDRLKVAYHYTKDFRNEKEALEEAKKGASSLYYKFEGKFGLPSFTQISNEAKLTGIPMKKLFEDHIYDMMRWYAIPTEEDSISSKDIVW